MKDAIRARGSNRLNAINSYEKRRDKINQRAVSVYKCAN